jgi:hypothetical protein
VTNNPCGDADNQQGRKFQMDANEKYRKIVEIVKKTDEDIQLCEDEDIRDRAMLATFKAREAYKRISAIINET